MHGLTKTQTNHGSEKTSHILLSVLQILLLFAEKSGHVLGFLKGLPQRVQIEMVTHLMVSEGMENSAIEGEYFSRSDIMSLI